MFNKSNAYALVKINEGASVFQDMAFCKWPQCKPPQYEYEGEEYRYGTKFPDAVFIAEKRNNGRGAEWHCERPGYGQLGNGGSTYGNGALIVTGEDCVKMLTPLLGYKPDLSNEPPKK